MNQHQQRLANLPEIHRESIERSMCSSVLYLSVERNLANTYNARRWVRVELENTSVAVTRVNHSVDFLSKRLNEGSDLYG